MLEEGGVNTSLNGAFIQHRNTRMNKISIINGRKAYLELVGGGRGQHALHGIGSAHRHRGLLHLRNSKKKEENGLCGLIEEMMDGNRRDHNTGKSPL